MRWSAILERALNGQAFNDPLIRPERTWTSEYAIWRYCRAKEDSPTAYLDHAILLRQCLRWSPRVINADHLGQQELIWFEEVGISKSISGTLEVQPYRPRWLDDNAGTDTLDERPYLAVMDESFPAESWLESTTGKKQWRSVAQKEGCWEVLQANPGSTCLVGLPTGAGKSLIFQVAATLSPALTVVVVPTVALGLDQLAVAKNLPMASVLNPQIYSSQEDCTAVLETLVNRQCRLLFTSPEACVSGRLKPVLDKHAEDGWLELVVVDEAHIVESWGADFRIEFQLLGALVRDWRIKSQQQLKTLLLSATFSTSTIGVLRRIFLDNGDAWQERVVQRLRPEIHYHFQKARNDEEKRRWVIETLMHMPRPMILYVTEKADAESYYEAVRGRGLQRLACFHGDTPDGMRNHILEEWRADKIDLIIATSAFGMGVDKSDIRCVLHACFPESIDRFYQEVGRGGRDGASTQSVMIYTEEDKRVGGRLIPTLLLPETITDRWTALWNTRRSIDGGSEAFQVQTAARRDDFVGRRTYQENVRWNKRLLQMLHRSGLLKVTGLVSEKSVVDEGEYEEWATITNISFPPFDFNVGERLSDQRDQELEVFRSGREALIGCTNGNAVCCELKDYYGGQVLRACGSCAACRSGKVEKKRCGHLIWPEDSLIASPRVQVVPMDRLTSRRGKSEWVLALRKTIREGIAHRFVTTEKDYGVARELLKEASGERLVKYRLDIPDERTVFWKDERIIVLHLTHFSESLSEFNSLGRVCSHWLPKDQQVDQYGRIRFTQENGARFFDSIETWLCQS